MRRSIGLVLVGLGVLMLVLAPLARWYAYPRLAVVPNDVAERVSVGSDITVLDLGAVVRQEAEVERVTDLRSVRRIIPDQGESSGDTAVWDTSVTNFDALGEGATPEENVLSYFEERVAFDRHSAASVDGHDQYYTPTGERADRVEVDHQGYYFKLPFGTEQRTYPFWDSTIQDTRPLEFQSETTLEGLPVYVFQQVIEPTPVSALEIPGALFGQTGSIVADRIYSNTRTLWVEPQTGAVIKGQEEQDSYLDFEGTRGPTIVQGTLAYTGDQVTANVDEFASSAEQLELVRDTVPMAAAAGGLVFVVIGLLLARRGSYGGKRRAPLPADGVSDGTAVGAAVGAGREAGIVAGSTVVTRPVEQRTPLQQRPMTRSPEPARPHEPPRVLPYEAPRYDEPRHQEPAAPRYRDATPAQYGEVADRSPGAGTTRYDDAGQPYTDRTAGTPRRYDARSTQYADAGEAAVVAGSTRYDDAGQAYADRSGAAPGGHDDTPAERYADEAPSATAGYEGTGYDGTGYEGTGYEGSAPSPHADRFAEPAPSAQYAEQPYADQPYADQYPEAAAPEQAAPAESAATEQPSPAPPAEQPGERTPLADRPAQSLPRRPQSSAVRPPVGRPHVQPNIEQSQHDAALERTRSDLARLERAREELARFAQANPDLAGAASEAAENRTPPAPEPAVEPRADDPRPAAPSQSGRRRARDDDGLFDEFDEDGQSAGSLHRY